MISVIKKHIYSVSWNLFLISAGSVIFAIGLKAIAVPHQLITGGTTGVSLLVYYFTGWLSPGIWYFLINIPIFLIGWFFISRRFFIYSLFGMAILSLAIDLVSFKIPIHDQFLAVLAGGTIMGAGAGIILHSLGSAGGNDIIAIILHQRFSIRMGSFFFAFNLILFSFSFSVLETDLVLYSLALSFIISQVLDHVLTVFNQRKMVLVIADSAEQIARAIMDRFNRGATFLKGSGAFTGRPKNIILTVVHNYQLKRLEETVFTIDADAFMITENTFNVLGKGFSRRKVY